MPRDEALQSLTRDDVLRQRTTRPVHNRKPASKRERKSRRAAYETVGQVMHRDLKTAHEEDAVRLAEAMMRWEGIRHIPVENNDGELVGMFTLADVVHALRTRGGDDEGMRIGEIMHKDPLTVAPDTPTLDAIRLMRAENLSAVPVVEGNKLEGILTDSDFLVVAARLLE